jgi:transposase
MSPSAKDKEKLVIDLLKKGYKTREITKLAHVSNTTVKKIRAKLASQARGAGAARRPKEKTLVRSLTGIQPVSGGQVRCQGHH